MKGWLRQLAGVALVIVFALGIGGFILVLRAEQQTGLASSMAAANIKSLTPPDGAVNVPVSGDITAQYVTRPLQDPVIKLEPVAGIVLSNGQWEGSTYVIHYSGLRENSLYHVELDQDSGAQKGEHKQIKVRWSFHTGSGSVTPTNRTPSPSASPIVSPTASPAAVPDLIWYYSSNLKAIDWNGKSNRDIKWVGDEQSPDGHFIYDSMTPSTWVYDANGNQLPGDFGGMWADDSRHFCGLDNRGGTTKIIVKALDGSSQTTGPISLQTPGTMPLTQRLVTCSVLTGRAIIVGVDTTHEWIFSMALVSLSDGSIIYQRRYPNPVAQMVASHDGHYIAEQLPGNASTPLYTFIRELPSGNQVGQVSGLMVSGFSWDGSLIAGATGTRAGFTGAEVLHWQDQRVIWNACHCASPFAVHVIEQPGGSKLALMATDNHNVGALTIVDANGSATSVPLGNSPATPLF